MKSLGQIDVTMAHVEREALVLEEGREKKVSVKLTASTAEYLANKLHEWLRDRELELSAVRKALKGEP